MQIQLTRSAATHCNADAVEYEQGFIVPLQYPSDITIAPHTTSYHKDICVYIQETK